MSWQDRRISRLAAAMATRTGTEQAGRWATPAGDRDRSRRPQDSARQRRATGHRQAAPAHRAARASAKTATRRDQPRRRWRGSTRIKPRRAQPQLSRNRQDVKLGPIRARRDFASSAARAADPQKPFIGRAVFSVFREGKKSLDDRTTRFCRTLQRRTSCARELAHELKLALRPPSAPDAAASTASRPTFVTIAQRPSCRDGTAHKSH